MNKKSMIVMAVAIALVVTTAIVMGASYEPGSSEDPLVTKSYVDAKITEALGSGSGSQAGSSFTPVKVEAGKKLVGGEGAELILRSGRAKAVTPGQDGLSDVTEGKDISGGKEITKNHLLLIPRDDGRGIEATTEIWVMVKGSYKIN